MRADTERLGTEPVAPLLLKLALPSMVGLLISSFYVVVDRVFVGRCVGVEALAAMNAAMPIGMLIFAVAILIGRGTSVLYSISLGRRDYAQAQRLFGMSLALFSLSAAAITFGGLAFLRPLLAFFGVPDETIEFGVEYMSISLLGTLPWMLSFQNNLIRAEGYSTLAMGTQLLGAGVNLVLDYLFVARFSWGMAGAAWATVIAQTASALWVMSFFAGGRSVVKIEWKSFRLPGFELLWQTLYNGCSPFFINISGSIIWTVQNHMLQAYGGVIAMSAFGVILTINQVLLTPLFGISMGMQPLVGYNTGARNYRRVIDAFRQAVKLSVIIALVPYLTVELFPEAIMRLFAEGADSELIAVGGYSMRRFLLLMPLGCGSILISQYFQGAGKAPMALLIALLRQLVLQLPLTFLLPYFFGYDGVLVSGPIGDSTAFLVACLIMRRELARLRELERTGPPPPEEAPEDVAAVPE